MKAINITKYLSYAFLGLLALIILIVMLALSPLGVNLIIGAANNVEGLQIENSSGSFYSKVSLGKVRFNNPQINIAADALNLDIGLNCIFAGEACIDEISARKFEITLIENDIESPASEPTTEYIELPLAAYLHKLAIGQVSIFTQKTNAEKTLLTSLSNISASVFMHKNLVVNNFSISDTNVVLPLASTPQDAAPVSNSGEHWIELLKNAQYTPIVLPEIFIPINADIKNIALANFCLQQSQGVKGVNSDLLCTKQTQLTAVIKQQKVNVTFTSQPLKQIASNVNLNAKIDFNDSFKHDVQLNVRPNASLSSSAAQALNLSLLGNVSDTQLKLTSSRNPNSSIVDLHAQFGLAQSTLPVNVELLSSNYQAVLKAWLPQVAVPVSSLTASINGTTQAYDFTAVAKVDSEQASELKLRGKASLNDKFIQLQELTTNGDIGTLNANVNAKLTQFANTHGVSVTSNIGFNKLQLQPLVASINSNMNGNIKLNANITPTQLWGDLNCSKVQGVLQGYKLSVLCEAVISKAGVVNIKSLNVKQGNNTIIGKGKFTLPAALNTNELNSLAGTDSQFINDTTTDLVFDINISDLTSLYADASGAILAKVKVGGRVDKPSVVANATISKLDLTQVQIQQAQLDATIDIANNWQTDINLKANEIWQGTMLAKQVDVSAKGNLSSHNISLSLAHPDYGLRHNFSGETIISDNTWRWLGSWETGMFESAFDTFTLDKATNIRVNPTSASIRPHCWVSSQLANEQSSIDTPINAFTTNDSNVICIEQMQYTEALTQVSAKLGYNLSIPLLHFFPDIVKQGTSLPFTTDIELNYSANEGIELDAHTLMTQANITGSKHKIELVAVVANSSLKDQVLNTNVFAGTKATGAVGLNSRLVLDPNNRTHTGQLRIDNFMLSPLQRFIPTVEKLSGVLAGNILFDGLLVEPDLNGELNINDVELVADNYPYPITNFNQTITIANKQADIEGEFELGAGMADYLGTLRLFGEDKPFSFEGEIRGAGMQIAFADNELLASPNLKIAVDPSNFSLKGEITIPNAEFAINEVPPSAKSASSDTLIIGKPPEPPAIPMGLDIDIRILIDPSKLKRVTVDAFDLQASLGGDLRVQVLQKQNPDTKEFSPLETYVYGEVNILSGSYEAYGQNLLVRKGAIFFSGAPSLPQFDITAVRNPLNTANNVVAGVRISGNPVVPKVELFSQPVMIQARQLSYLLRGTDLGGGKSDSQDVMLVNMLVGFGVGNSENGVNRIGKSLGFDSLNVQTAGQGDSTQVQLTGRISDKIQVIYGVGLFDQATEVILRYQLLPKMYIEATGGATSAVDLFYEWSRGQ